MILSINPDLTGQQVRDIIEQTAQKVGGCNYVNDGVHTNGTWNIEMGYGLVDAFAAVKKALEYYPCYSGENYAVSNHVSTDRILIDTTFGYGTITIDSGATLTVKSVLRMDKNSQIIVKKGGALVVEGGIITSACDGLWQGILIEEDTHNPF